VYGARLVPNAPVSVGGSKKRKGKTVDKTKAALRKKIVVKRRKRVSQFSEKTSVVEKVLAKPLKPSKKDSFSERQGRASGLNVAEKFRLKPSKKDSFSAINGARAVGSARVPAFVDSSSKSSGR
jgi:hypothetical protein